jgi:hypothetical protein
LANPTTNYGWVLPTPTDLVTDLPADFDVALQGVDTTTKALNPSTTLGDVEYRSATANTNTRLGIGTTGQVLSVVGGVPAWASPSGGAMTVIASGNLSGASFALTSIPTTYNYLELVLRGVRPSVDNASLKMRLNNDSTASRYYSMTTLPSQGNIAWNGNSMSVADSMDDTISQFSATIKVLDYSNASTWKTCLISCVSNSDGTSTSGNWRNNFAGYNQIAAITEVNLFLDSSATFSAGSYILYGVK